MIGLSKICESNTDLVFEWGMFECCCCEVVVGSFFCSLERDLEGSFQGRFG